MRRKIFAITALLALVVCGVAYAAASNSYTASYSAKAVGTKSKPVKVAMTEKLAVKAPSSSDRGGYPLKDINTTIVGLKSGASSFKTCTATTIDNSSTYNAACPNGSEIASGTVKSVIGSANNLSKTGAFQCDLDLHVYNGGGGKVTYFFTVPSGACGPLATGAASAWTGTVKESDGKLINNVPEPPDVSTNAGNVGLWGSLESETLNWKKGAVESIGCKAGKRSYSTKFTATNGKTETSATVKGSSKC